jgi:hypothetical protein
LKNNNLKVELKVKNFNKNNDLKVGIKVIKVWHFNNKHTLVKKYYILATKKVLQNVALC